MTRFYRTTYTFTHPAAAETFTRFLRRYAGDANYGRPRFIDSREVGRAGEVCVEYEAETEFAHGLAVGCDAMARSL